MPCCILGAIFLSQCIAVFAWIKRRFGFAHKAGRERCGNVGAFLRRPKTLAVIVCFELMLVSVFLIYSGDMLDMHLAHAEHLTHTH